MGVTEYTSFIMMALLFARLAQMAMKVLRPCLRIVALCVGCAVASIAFLVPLTHAAAKMVSPQRDLGRFIPLNITPSVIFSTALFMCVVYATLSVYIFVSTVVVPILAKGPIMLVPKDKAALYDLRDRKATLAA